MKRSSLLHRRLIWLSCLIVLSAVVVGAAIFAQWPDEQNLQIVVCDVGQGDAILLTQGFTQVLFDAGPNGEAVLRCLGRVLPFWDRQIEWIIPTHLDSDHIGGFPAVMERYQVKNLLLSLDAKETADFDRFEEAVLREQKRGCRLWRPVRGAEMRIHPAWRLSIIYVPDETSGRNKAQFAAQTETQLWDVKSSKALSELSSNNRSTVLSLRFGRVGILLTGDAEESVEQALLAAGMVEPHTILKVSHHGSKTSSSLPFLNRVRPEYALISVGKNNRFGHPAAAVLDRLQRVGVDSVLRTDQLGTIVLHTDGQSVWQ